MHTYGGEAGREEDAEPKESLLVRSEEGAEPKESLLARWEEVRLFGLFQLQGRIPSNFYR